jgi:hypothetical protein
VEGCLERIGETTPRETALPGPLGGQNPAGCSNSKPTTIFRNVDLGNKDGRKTPLGLLLCYGHHDNRFFEGGASSEMRYFG